MGDKIKYGLVAILGAAVGSAVTWKILKTKYESITQEEIDGMREYFEEKYGNAEDETENEEEEEIVAAENVKVDTNKPSIAEYASILDNNGYRGNRNYSNPEDREEEESMNVDGITVIDPEDFGENEDYDIVVLYYYAGDGMLATEDNVLLDDMEHKVGFEALDTFGRYEDDAVHVRNDNNKTYYEILRDAGKYSEIAK